MTTGSSIGLADVIDDPVIRSHQDLAAFGMRLGGGPILQQLALEGDEADIHWDGVRRAIAQHERELKWLAGPPVKLNFRKPDPA